MAENETIRKKGNDDKNPKLKLIIISKKAKIDKSGEGRVITLKKDEGRMELRMDNMSENITRKKIEKTVQSIIFNKSVSDIKARSRKFIITSNNYKNKLNTLSERELVYVKSDMENNKNNDINDGKYSEKKKYKKIEEKISRINNSKNENEKNCDVFNDVNNENTKNNFNSNNNSNTNNNIINNASECKTSNLDDDNSQKDEIIFVKNNNNKGIQKNININEEVKSNGKNEEYLIKNTEIKNDKKGLNIKENNTEPNNLINRKNKFKELLKRDNMINDEDGDEEIEIEECPEDIISHMENYIKDYESNKAMKNELSEKENKYIISSCNDGLNNFNNYFRTSIKINSDKTILDKEFNTNDNTTKKENNNTNNNNCPEELAKNNNNYFNNDINIPNQILNNLYSKVLIGNNNNNNLNKKINVNNQNTKNENSKNNNNNNNKESRNKNYFGSYIQIHQINPMNKTCSICENIFPTSKIYVAECSFHFLCKRCAKNFYEEKIESGQTEFKCPFLKCGAKFPKQLLKNFISEEHLNIFKKNLNNDASSVNNLKADTNYEKIKLYYNNHVIDINNNKLLYNYNKNKDIFCGRCNKDTLFSKVNNNFLKCLNCEYCECKYCFKEFKDGHMNINSTDRCKVYYRKNEYFNEMNKFINFLIQLFLVFAMFFMIFISIFLNLKEFFKNICSISKKDIKKNCLLYIIEMSFVIILSCILLLICTPFIIVWFPFFPSILSLSDY